MKQSERESMEEDLAANAKGPRITIEDLENQIVKEQYYIFPGSTLTVCALTLRNGFMVTGESACADPENFDMEIGQRIARSNAREKIWAFMGYMLREKLWQGFLQPTQANST